MIVFNGVDGINNLRVGSNGGAVAVVQAAINEKGFGPAKVDGIFGAETKELVQQFQYASGLSVDGVAGRNTQNLLGLIQGWNTSNERFVVPSRFLTIYNKFEGKSAPTPTVAPVPAPVPATKSSAVPYVVGAIIVGYLFA